VASPADAPPHPGRPIEVSPGILEPKHFAGKLGSAALLYLKFVHETAFGDTRWRSGAWVPKGALASVVGVNVWRLRRWIDELEEGEYIRVQRGAGGWRITLRHRIWYRMGKPIKAVHRKGSLSLRGG
jgi:hypothetical protein